MRDGVRLVHGPEADPPLPQESNWRCIEGERYQLEGPRTEGCVGIPLEVLEVNGVDTCRAKPGPRHSFRVRFGVA